MMLTVPAPAAINGLQLADELAAAGYRDVVVVLDPDADEVRVAAKTDSGADIGEQSRSKVESVVSAHAPATATPVPPLTDDEIVAVRKLIGGSA